MSQSRLGVFNSALHVSVFRYRIRGDPQRCHHADGQQRHVLTNQRGRRGEQNMCRRQERGRRVWCKGSPAQAVVQADACRIHLCWCFLSEVSFSLLFPQKDNGGPLVCREHERKVIVGVSIQRTKCASSQPALFVNVAFYSEWIYKVFKLYPNADANWQHAVKTQLWRRQRSGQGNSKNVSSLTHEGGVGKMALWKVAILGFCARICEKEDVRRLSDWRLDTTNGICSSTLQMKTFGSSGRMSILPPAFLARERRANCFLTCSEFLKPRKSIISWNLLENGLKPALWVIFSPFFNMLLDCKNFLKRILIFFFFK